MARTPASSSLRRSTSASTNVDGAATLTSRPYSPGSPLLTRRSTRDRFRPNAQRSSSANTPTTANDTRGPKAYE